MTHDYGPAVNGESYRLFSTPRPPEREKSNYRLNLVLFLLTVLTTVTIGALIDGVDIAAEPHLIYRGIPFSASLLLILGLHESAHYIASRLNGLRVTLPFFIPLPLPPIGTLGAIIRIKSPIMDRPSLLDVGVSGPLAGFAVTLPVAVIGLKLSQIRDIAETGRESIALGSSLMFNFLVWLFAPESAGNGHLVLHPVAFAAWVGLLVTALNLLPIGQLDGGHIICALFGRYQRYISIAFLALMIPLGFLWPGWLVWAALLIIIGWKHPLPPNMYRPLNRRRKFAGFLCIAVFILTFTPVPFSINIQI